MSQPKKQTRVKSKSPVKGSDPSQIVPILITSSKTGKEIEGSMTIRFADSARLVVDELTLHSTDENGIEPADIQLLGTNMHTILRDVTHFIVNNVRPTGDPKQPIKIVESADPVDLWLIHLKQAVPDREGETKAQWIARVWREYYEPTGRSMKELGLDLGLTHATVRGYCSQEDPNKKKKAVKKVNSRG